MKLKITLPRVPDDLRDTIGFALVIWIVCLIVVLLLSPGCAALARCRQTATIWQYREQQPGQPVIYTFRPDSVTTCRY